MENIPHVFRLLSPDLVCGCPFCHRQYVCVCACGPVHFYLFPVAKVGIQLEQRLAGGAIETNI